MKKRCTCHCQCHPGMCAKVSKSARCGECRKMACQTKADLQAIRDFAQRGWYLALEKMVVR